MLKIIASFFFSLLTFVFNNCSVSKWESIWATLSIKNWKQPSEFFKIYSYKPERQIILEFLHMSPLISFSVNTKPWLRK